MTEKEISQLVIPLLELCDRAGREHIAGLAMAAWIDTFPANERGYAMTAALRQFARLTDRDTTG
jgi:hypothetical protein